MYRQALRIFFLGFVITFPYCSIAQSSQHRAAREKQEEEQTLPYLPNAFHNKKTTPANPYFKHTTKLSSGSTITTVQVNVDANGFNIVGDAANEPNLSVNPQNPNEMVIGWRQFDNIASDFRQAGWAYTSNGGFSWTFPGEIEQGVFRTDPVLDFDSIGSMYYNSLTHDSLGNFLCTVFKSIDGGITWDTGTPAAGGDKQWMAIDRTSGIGSGNIYSAWSPYYTSCYPDNFTRSTNGGNSYENCTTAEGGAYWGTMTIDKTGNLFVCGVDSLSDSLLVSKSVVAQIPGSTITWNPPVRVFMDGYIGFQSINTAGLTGQAYIDVDRSNGAGAGNVYLFSSLIRTGMFDMADVMFARSTDGGLTWSAPIRVNDDSSTFNYQWFGTMSVAPNGRIDAVWLDTREDQSGFDSSALYYSYSVDQGSTWSANEKLSGLFDPHVGYPVQQKMGDYYDMISDNTGAHLAWTNTLNGEEDVYYSYITPAITGLAEPETKMHYSVYPNPTSSSFILTGPDLLSQVEIYNALGSRVFSKSIRQASTEINFASQSAGLYFLKIMRDGVTLEVHKILKK